MWNFRHCVLLFLLACMGHGLMHAQSGVCVSNVPKRAKKKYEQARDLSKSNKSEARKLLLELVEEEPDYVEANQLLAELLLKTKAGLLGAEPYLSKAASICPEGYGSNFFLLGQSAFQQKRFESAEQYLNMFLKQEKAKAKDLSDAREMLTACKFFVTGYANPVPFNPEPLSEICSEADEYYAMITPDDQFFFFNRVSQELQRDALGEREVAVERFSVSKKIGNNRWEKGAPLPAPFNRHNNEGGATLTADNKYLYFTICKPEGKSTLNCDIYYTVNVKGQWTEIRNAGPKINTKDYWESQPSISSDGQTLYFASNRPGGLGNIDIYKSTKQANGEWGEAINLGPIINTPESEKSPFFHSDGRTLYFASNGHLGFGGYDIFMSKLSDDGQWSIPKNIGYPINSEREDIAFFVSTDGKKGYFASDKLKGNGGWDIYSFDLYAGARPEKVLFLSGELKDEQNRVIADAKMEIKNLRTKESKSIEVDSITGKYAAVVAFTDDHVLTVKKQGKAFDSEFFSKDDSTRGTFNQKNIRLQDIKVGRSYTLNDIRYETNSDVFGSQTAFLLKEFALYLAENPTLKVTIIGHTDNVGRAEDNLQLSEKRAKRVYDYLVEQGIDSKRLNFKGLGSNKPLVSNATEAGRAKNRRTEFQIIGM